MAPKKGLCPEVFTKALERHYALPRRAGRHESYSELFADNHQLQPLDTVDWQIIYGRRGAGKTTLLGALKERIEFKYNEKKSIALKINLFDCIPSSPVNKDIDDRRRGYAYFAGFIDQLCSSLYESYLDSKNSSLIWRLVNQSGKKRHIEGLLVEILSLAQNGVYVPGFSDSEQKEIVYEKSSSKSEKSASGRVDAKGKVLGMSDIAAESSISAGKRHDYANDLSHETSISMISAPHFGVLRKKIIEFLDLIDTKCLFILIDEWLCLDQHSYNSLQPFFADALKRTFGGTPKFSVKIASIRYRSQFSNKGEADKYLGMELGDDIYEGTDLDQVYATDINLFDFYSELLFKRLKHCDERISRFEEKFEGAPTGKPVAGFVTSIFQDRDCFMEIIRGSGCIPREFISIFNSVSIQKNFSTNFLWKISEVRREIIDHSINTKFNEIASGSVASILLDRITDIFQKTGYRVFLINSEQEEEIRLGLDELFEKRLIHHVPPTLVPHQLRREFNTFYVDYGHCLDVLKEKRQISDLCPLDDGKTVDDAENFIVDTRGILGQKIVCRNCGASFLNTERSYKLKSLCPVCFEAVIYAEAS